MIIKAIIAAVGTICSARARQRLRFYWYSLFRWKWFHGDFSAWQIARAESAGYDHEAVLQKVVRATRAVRSGDAHWERDGTLFFKSWCHDPLVRTFHEIAAAEDNVLDIVDVGGSLGSTYRQYASKFSGLKKVRWRVVEQQNYVNAGAEFQTEVLSFRGSIALALDGGPPVAVLLSSVLPYLEKPYALIGEIVTIGFKHVLIDRTPTIVGGKDRLCVQRTPSWLGGGTYPCWLFNRDQLLSPFSNKYKIVREWKGFDNLDRGVDYIGVYFKKND